MGHAQRHRLRGPAPWLLPDVTPIYTFPLIFAVGIVRQTGLTASPIFLVVKDWQKMGIALAVVAACSLILKKNWLDKLHEEGG